jgi:hypothetical protein
MVFYRFWGLNTAGKTVTKVGIYALPPLGGGQKVTFIENYGFYLITTHGSGNLSRPNFTHIPFLLKYNIIKMVRDKI